MVRKHGITLQNKRVLVIGNGGASAAIQAAVRHEQAAEMIVVDIVKGNGAISYEECFAHHLDAQVIINTSPVGMYPKSGASPLDLALFHCLEAVLDVVYNPLSTKLVLDAKDRGLPGVNGLEMLVAQAKQAVEHFLDTLIDDAVIDTLYKKIERGTKQRDPDRHAKRRQDDHWTKRGTAMRKGVHRHGCLHRGELRQEHPADL